MNRPVAGSRIAGVAVATAVAATATLWLPWLQSGRRARDAFATARSAEALDVVSGPLGTVLPVLAVFLPAVVAGAVLALAVRRRGLAVGLAGSAAAVVLAVAAGLARAAGDAPVEVGVGARLGGLAGATAVLAALAALEPFRRKAVGYGQPAPGTSTVTVSSRPDRVARHTAGSLSSAVHSSSVRRSSPPSMQA